MQDLSSNKLSSVPPDIGFLSYCTHLNLSNNMLTELPEDIGGLIGTFPEKVQNLNRRK